MAASLSALSASVTRILSLTGFPKELKTKDIQSAFADWETINGGFKIKWKDDTSLLIVFQDPSVAKRAYLQAIAFPPPILTSSSTGVSATIKPYDGADAQAVIQNVNSRGQHGINPSRSHNARSASISVFPSAQGRGTAAVALNNGHTLRNSNSNNNIIAIPQVQHQNGREPSPTLPSLPSHPTLNSLINSSLGEVVARDADNDAPSNDPAILAASLQTDNILGGGGPRIGDSGKRMLGAALGVRHPGLNPRGLNGGSGNPGSSPVPSGGVDQAIREVQRAMTGLAVAE